MKRWWREKDSNLRRLSRQIYSLIPLAAREPLHKYGTDNIRKSRYGNKKIQQIAKYLEKQADNLGVVYFAANFGCSAHIN